MLKVGESFKRKRKILGKRSLSTRILFFVSTLMVEGHFLSPTPRRNLLHLVTSVSFPLALDPRRVPDNE